MSTPARNKKPTRKNVRPAPQKQRKPKTFGEWARSVSGIVKGAPADLSTREGFGD
jgi:hypothetical protein